MKLPGGLNDSQNLSQEILEERDGRERHVADQPPRPRRGI
jgi:hypothetical protein